MLADWADGIWNYSRGEGADTESRFLKVEGRGVGLEERRIDLDDTGRAIFRDVGRSHTKIDRIVASLVKVVEQNPGITVTEARAQMTGSTDAKQGAPDKAHALGLIKIVPNGRQKLLYPADEPMRM